MGGRIILELFQKCLKLTFKVFYVFWSLSVFDPRGAIIFRRVTKRGQNDLDFWVKNVPHLNSDASLTMPKTLLEWNFDLGPLLGPCGPQNGLKFPSVLFLFRSMIFRIYHYLPYEIISEKKS